MHNHYHKKTCGCKENLPCGCNEPKICGCSTKHDLLCDYYSGPTLEPIGIFPGMDGNTVIKTIVDHFEDEIGQIETDPTTIKSIGGKVDIYKGLSDAFVHEIKSIQGQPNGGVIVENKQTSPEDCTDKGDYINVRIDTDWLTNFLNNWIASIDICSLIEKCNQPIDQNPEVTDIPFSLSNRGTKTFNLTDFASHFTDPQSDGLSTIRLIGNVSGYKLNGSPYVVNTEITALDLNSGSLQYIANDIDSLYTYSSPYQAKDTQGNWSNIANIIATVTAKIYIDFSPVTVPLIRAVSNNKFATVSYTNGSGQILSAGQVLYVSGTPGNPGYLKITVQSGTTLNGSGSFSIVVDSFPFNNQSNQSVPYIIDGSTGNVYLTYNSNPVTQNIVIGLPNRGTHEFTTAEFVAAYTDFDGDNLSQIRATSNVNGYMYDANGTGNYVPYVANTWIPVNNIAKLKYVALNQNSAYSTSTPWQAKDTEGNIST